MAWTISRMGWIWRMEVRELATKEISRMMAEVMKNRPMKERHMLIRDRASITARTMPTVPPSSWVTGTATTNCRMSYAPPMLLRPW